MSEKIIADALGLRSLEEVRAEATDVEFVEMPEEEGTEVVTYQESLPPAIPEPDHELIDDIDTARNNIKNMLDAGADGLAELLIIAKQTENPRAFEVVATMMNTMLNVNRELVNMSKEKKFEKNDSPSQHTTNVTNNNLVLTTNDLLNLIKAQK